MEQNNKMTPKIIEEIAPAKLNLFLHITGKRLSGYHELLSLVVFTELADRVKVEEGRRLTLKVTGPCADELLAETSTANNLVIRAAKALQDQGSRNPGAKIHLEKNLPVAAGIGGGSSDAAATMKALTNLWGQVLPLNKVKKIARSLGADVPVCLTRHPAIIRGIGDRVEVPPELPKMHVVLVNPGYFLPTEDVFENLNWKKAVRKRPVAIPRSFDDEAHFVRFLRSCRNDLQEPAIDLLPEIEDVLDYIQAQRGCKLARMSGSGATCFGLFSNERNAIRAQEEIAVEVPEWWVERTKY